MNKSEVLTGFVENTIKQLLKGADNFTVAIVQSTKNIIVQIAASQEDRGRIIGKKGITVEAIKILTVGVKNSYFPEDRRKIILEILEEDDSYQRNV